MVEQVKKRWKYHFYFICLINKEDELNKKLIAELSKDPSSKELQQVVCDIVILNNEKCKFLEIK